MAHRLIAIFPDLARDGYRETSPATWDYNCIAWAASRTDQWWEPDPDLYWYWPPGVARQYTLQAYGDTDAALGYEPCNTGDFEIAFEKIVLFIDASGIPTHAARQLENGKWTSKLGGDVDIEHATPDALNGQYYGAPVLSMRRPRPVWRRPIAALKRAWAVLCARLRTRSVSRG